MDARNLQYFSTKDLNHRQTTLFRLNCLDCTDRTTLMSSKLAELTIVTMLNQINAKIMTEGGPKFLEQIKKCFFKLNNKLSLQYTGAESTINSEGKTSFFGKMGSAIGRSIAKNFNDKLKSSCLRIVLGKHRKEITTDVLRAASQQLAINAN